MSDVVGLRALNRTLLARQGLLQSLPGGVEATVRHLVGLQSQTPTSPYPALWTRLGGDFDFAEPGDLLTRRRLVRLALMRGTVHLVTAEDAPRLRRWVQPALESGLRGSSWAAGLAGVDRAGLIAHGRDLMREHPCTPAELRAGLAAYLPGADADSLLQGLRAWAPLVQVPPRGVWGSSGGPRYALLHDWLGCDPDDELPAGPADAADAVRRYLAAFGPATPADMQKWSGLTGLRETFTALDLRTYTADDDGRVLYDLPDAPLTDPETPVPARLVADFDNVLLSHADRRRILAPADKARVVTVNGLVRGTVLVDGFVGGTWQFTRAADAAEVTVRPFAPLPDDDRAAVEAQATGYLAAAAPGAEHAVSVTPATA